MADAQSLRQQIKACSPTVWEELNAKAKIWLEATIDRCETSDGKGYPKTFNDPIWGEIKLFPWETLLLDSAMLQRLRHVRQLGMAHLVYPGAGYDRLEHSRGVVEAAERMIASLERNADFRRRFGSDKDDTIPVVSETDRNAIRLAALLHDVGHSAFSHATEQILASRLSSEFAQAEQVLRCSFDGVKAIAPAETISVLLVLSEPMKQIFEHVNFTAWRDDRPNLPCAIIARILGARNWLDAGYLSGVVSGPLDADKLDYMARDSHHAGLPIGLDLHRLISKLEIVTVTPESATNSELRKRADDTPYKKFHEIGISLSGLGAFEQMMIARVILYDRLYYHHKIRSAEAMVRRLIIVAEEERGSSFKLSDLFVDLPDDTVAAMIGGSIRTESFAGGKDRSAKLAQHINERRLHYRAFAFASRFLAGTDSLPDHEQRDTRAIIWRQILKELSTLSGCDEFSRKILEKAIQLRSLLPGLFGSLAEPRIEDVIVDLPSNKSVARGGDILTRTEDGHIAPPFLFFDPERWSQAYESQKQCGFVFAPRKHVKLIGLAARIVFFESFKAAMSVAADRASKTAGKITSDMFAKACEVGLCAPEIAEVYLDAKPKLAFISVADLESHIPSDVRVASPELCKRLAVALTTARRGGFSASIYDAVLLFISHAFKLAKSLFSTGDFKGTDVADEAGVQRRIMQYFNDAGVPVTEGSEVSGGETDIVLKNLLVIENKIVKTPTQKPHEVGEKFSWQARRYAIPISQGVAAEIVAYQPATEAEIVAIHDALSIKRISTETDFVVIRLVLPWNYGNPSSARAP